MCFHGKKKLMKKCGYTEDTEEKGKISFTGILQREEFSKTLSQAMYVLKEEIRVMKNERKVYLLIFSHCNVPN